ncbi:16S rRNA m(7)G-527 methyltransferase [Terriglobus roseus DSM 18391]|uniref:Ribosomal RNA small subunit methyltransferase G n=1 Tax=Terriglobus roseus (strain DSM 18391 / NRRL B-41598 / KBS 63) TaxID=926566 RepID=I3ZMV4_TERRK|nr:16S rRNA (guanine(527)-N(7))-methyltransferase RsmG [Terriglobus roseus]AFL90572.1 16S rRNA m(7)G-527 methyltransferase [Terriglobus roseus DSM 18391]
MPTLLENRIADLLEPYLAGGPELAADLIPRMSRYLDLLMLWNAKTNLTAIREPAQLVQRQLGESLFAARFLPATGTLLDFGSGGGFPGIPLQLAFPDLRVTLAESQGKKAGFLREATRSLALNAEVWSSRVESMPSDRSFDIVAMRAVDQAAAMLPIAQERVAHTGQLLRYLPASEETHLGEWDLTQEAQVPLSQGRIALWKRA